MYLAYLPPQIVIRSDDSQAPPFPTKQTTFSDDNPLPPLSPIQPRAMLFRLLLRGIMSKEIPSVLSQLNGPFFSSANIHNRRDAPFCACFARFRETLILMPFAHVLFSRRGTRTVHTSLFLFAAVSWIPQFPDPSYILLPHVAPFVESH